MPARQTRAVEFKPKFLAPALSKPPKVDWAPDPCYRVFLKSFWKWMWIASTM